MITVSFRRMTTSFISVSFMRRSPVEMLKLAVVLTEEISSFHSWLLSAKREDVIFVTAKWKILEVYASLYNEFGYIRAEKSGL